MDHYYYLGDPQGCTYDSSLKEYSCSFRSWSLPLAYSQFSNPVQVLKVVDVDGELPSTGMVYVTHCLEQIKTKFHYITTFDRYSTN